MYEVIEHQLTPKTTMCQVGSKANADKLATFFTTNNVYTLETYKALWTYTQIYHNQSIKKEYSL